MSPLFVTTINGVNYAGDQILVYFQPGTDSQTQQAIFALYGLTPVLYAPINGMYQCQIAANADVQAVQAQLRSEPSVQEANLNTIAEAASVPTDYLYPLFNMPGGSTYYTTQVSGSIRVQWALVNIHMEAAWSRTKGSQAYVIGILDSGIQTTHEDLQPKIMKDASGVPTGAGVYSSSFEEGSPIGHGSSVAGIAAANTTFGPGAELGIAGVCPLSPIYPVKITDIHNQTMESDITTGINKAMAVPGMKVINISYAFLLGDAMASPDTLSSRTKLFAAVQQATEQGVLVVVAMGNRLVAGQTQFPAALWNAMAVGATDVGDMNKAEYSSIGPYCSVAAPGGYNSASVGWIRTTFYSSKDGFAYHDFNGTSAAAPHVAGLAALTLSLYPGMMPWDMKSRLEDTSDDINPNNFMDAGGSYHYGLPGFDQEIGWGRINADRATQSQTTQAFNFPAGSAYRLISLPVWPTNAYMDPANRAGDISSLFPGAASVLWYSAALGKYLDYSDARVPRVGAGRSYWVKFGSPLSKSYTGALAYQSPSDPHPATLHLQPGWNFIGTPSTGSITWSLQNVQVRTFDSNKQSATYGQAGTGTLQQGNANGWLPYTYLYHFNNATGAYEKVTDPSDGSSSLHQLMPGEGYSIFAQVSCDVLLPAK